MLVTGLVLYMLMCIYVLIAYLIQSDLAHKQISIADVISLKILKRVRAKLTKIRPLENAQTLISEALQDMAAAKNYN